MLGVGIEYIVQVLCVIVSVCYCVIVSLCHCVILLLCYCVIVLLCYCVIVQVCLHTLHVRYALVSKIFQVVSIC